MLEICGALLPPAGNAGNRTARMTLCYPGTQDNIVSTLSSSGFIHSFIHSTSHGVFVHLVHRTAALSGSTATPSSSFSTQLGITGKMLAQHIRKLDQHAWNYRWDPTDDMKRSQSEELQSARKHLKGFKLIRLWGPGSEAGTNGGRVQLNVT